jgi:uncharacterized membrane protein YccC
MTLPSRSDWLFSIKAFIASMLALYVALLFDLPRPYWAMAAVYVVANPLAGATRSKGIYRALGTLIGAGASVVLLPMFVNAPVLLALVVSLWTGTLLYISMLDRTPRSYVFMLAGYSLPLIALPLVDSPTAVFDTAVARSEEIIVGIICASLVNAIVFPSSVGAVLSAKIVDWMRDAGEWTSDILKGDAPASTPLARQKLASDLSALDLLLTQISHDAAAVDTVKQAKVLRGKLLMLLPVLSSLGDRLHALRAIENAGDTELRSLFDDITAWATSGDARLSGLGGLALRRRIETAKAVPTRSLWERLIRVSALSRLLELIDLVEDCDSLRSQIATGRPDRHWSGKSRYKDVIRPVRHYDYALMFFSTAMVVLGTFLSTLLWIFTGWDSGAGFVTMMAVACSFFAAMDRPAPMVRLMLVWTGFSLVGSGIYLFAILPLVHDFPTLVLAFAVPFLLIGAVIPRPQYNIAAMLMTVNMASYVALQDRFTTDFASFANGGVAAFLGIAFALGWTLVTRPFGEELAAGRLLRQGWADLAQAASRTRSSDWTVLSGRLLDRLAQLAPRLSKVEGNELKAVDGLAEVRIGFNLLELQRERRIGSMARLVDPVLADTAAFFQARIRKGMSVMPSEALLQKIDVAIEGLSAGDFERMETPLNALVGLRRALFADAPPPHEMEPEQEELPAQLHAAE